MAEVNVRTEPLSVPRAGEILRSGYRYWNAVKPAAVLLFVSTTDAATSSPFP